MEIIQLLFFKKTAELEHMTKAANDLMVSQPYLSRTIAELEEELGIPLFDHVGRSIVLNPCGKAFYNRVTNIFNEIEDAKKEIQNINLSQQSRLTIVTNVSQYMPGLLELISICNPSVKIRQLSAKRRDIIRMLLNGEVDFALCSPPIEENVQLKTVHLRYEQGVIIYPQGHWLKNYNEVTFNDVKNETFISVSQGYGARDALDSYFEKLGITPKIAIETADTVTVFRYVEKGLGIATVPLSTVLQEAAFKDHYVDIPNRASGDIALSWRANQYISEAGHLFIEKSNEFFLKLEEFVEKNRIR
ncbi:MAG: LysR family transcriptional regulator [Clostridiales bacterium]|nr:LysR family transcriptional regulator [Clostridiales bacterium]